MSFLLGLQMKFSHGFKMYAIFVRSGNSNDGCKISTSILTGLYGIQNDGIPFCSSFLIFKAWSNKFTPGLNYSLIKQTPQIPKSPFLDLHLSTASGFV